MAKSVFVYSDKLSRFQAYEGYPWLFDRSDAVLALCRRHGLVDLPGVEIRSPLPVEDATLRSFHDECYLEALRSANGGSFDESMLLIGLGTTECPVYPGCMDYHRLVVGSSLAGVSALVDDGANVAFAPTGGMHHAGPDFAAGFCYLNDAVLAVRSLAAKGARVLYLDIDAHHGDGVQQALYADRRVLKVSFHESPETLFPFRTGFVHETGEGDGEGYNVNVPLLAGSGDEVFGWAFSRIVPPLVEAFVPDVLVAVLGADTLASDPMTDLMLTTAGYCDAIALMRGFAPKILALGCGGYALEPLERALTLAWATLNDVPVTDDAELLFGGAFRGDGLVSLHDRPVFIPDETRAKTMAACRDTVAFIEGHQFQVLKASPVRNG